MWHRCIDEVFFGRAIHIILISVSISMVVSNYLFDFQHCYSVMFVSFDAIHVPTKGDVYHVHFTSSKLFHQTRQFVNNSV